MKTLHYFTIVLLTTSICSGMGMSFAQYQGQMPHLIASLYTDKQNYVYNDTIIISGDIDKNEFKSEPWLDIEIRDPTGNILKNDMISINNTAHYTYKLKISSTFASGQYLVRVSNPYHGVDMGNLFTVKGSYVSPTCHGLNCIDLNSTGITSTHPLIHGINPTSIQSPLKQFKSGVLPENTQCPPNLALTFKAKDGTPACVKYTTANTLLERGWAKKIVQNIARSETTVIIPTNSSDINNGFTFSPAIVRVVIGENNTVQWINMDSVTNDITSDTGSFKQILIESGYARVHTFDKIGTYGYHSVIHPWLKGTVVVTSNPMMNLKNDTGIITLGNHTYYFETPNYTNDAYLHQVQISFHDVIFTLFPSGFRGGLPSSCGETYYWTDAKFSDNTSELLHIFAGPKCPVQPLPTYFSNHANPQAGLTFYDGKMKLLVSASANSSEHMETTISSQNQTKNLVNNIGNVTKLTVRNAGGWGPIGIGSDRFNQTVFFTGNVGKVKTGLPIRVSISDPYDMFVRKYEISSNDIAQDGLFNFTHTFLGKYDQDTYTLDFSYGNQKYDLKYSPIVPP